MGPHDRELSTRLADLVNRNPDIRQHLRITCSGLTDGAGAQAHAIMAALAFSKLTGVRYVHSPFQWMHHSNGDPTGWATAWESFLSLGAGEASLTADETPVPLDRYLATPTLHERARVVTTTRYHEFVERDSRGYESVLRMLRERYCLQDKSKIALHRQASVPCVAVHIRRGDVQNSPRRRHRKRYTQDRHILGTIRRIRSVIGSEEMTVNVYSEGTAADFADYARSGCNLHLDTDPFEAFHNCVAADVLVMAKSSFSYAAAILSNGVKVYEPFWHRPLSGWVTRSANPLKRLVNLEGTTLERALRVAVPERT